MNKGTYKRKLCKQKMIGLIMFIIGTLGSVLVSNWFIAMIAYPLGVILFAAKEIILE